MNERISEKLWKILCGVNCPETVRLKLICERILEETPEKNPEKYIEIFLEKFFKKSQRKLHRRNCDEGVVWKIFEEIQAQTSEVILAGIFQIIRKKFQMDYLKEALYKFQVGSFATFLRYF